MADKEKYIIEYMWGEKNPIHEEIEVNTDNISWTLDQIARNREGIEFVKIEKL